MRWISTYHSSSIWSQRSFHSGRKAACSYMKQRKSDVSDLRNLYWQNSGTPEFCGMWESLIALRSLRATLAYRRGVRFGGLEHAWSFFVLFAGRVPDSNCLSAASFGEVAPLRQMRTVATRSWPDGKA